MNLKVTEIMGEILEVGVQSAVCKGVEYTALGECGFSWDTIKCSIQVQRLVLLYSSGERSTGRS